MIQANVINAAYKYKAKKLIFFSSSCVYPKNCQQPMKEDCLMTGALEPTNVPYATAKLAGIEMCVSYNKQYGTKFITIIPANVYGINDNFNEDGHVLASLVEKFYFAKINKKKTVTLWGTGRPRREFLFSDDLAVACIELMKNQNFSDIINIGSRKDTTIKELAEIIKKIMGFNGDIICDQTKPDGNFRRSLDGSKMRTFGWQPATSLEEGIKKTYLWYKKNKVHQK